MLVYSNLGVAVSVVGIQIVTVSGSIYVAIDMTAVYLDVGA